MTVDNAKLSAHFSQLIEIHNAKSWSTDGQVARDVDQERAEQEGAWIALAYNTSDPPAQH